MTKFNAAVELDKGCFSVEGGTPKRLKKLTGTRFSKAIGCNHWSTPFQAWCEVMKVAEPPFEGNEYTAAGQAIEPKLIEYCRDIVSPYIVMPEEYYCESHRKWDFFPDEPIFGGMWDALAFARPDVNETCDDAPIAVIEAKTSSRPQDWMYGVPDNYKAQGLLYAYLIGVEDVYFPVAFMSKADGDYDHPERFECTDDNTRVFHLKVSESPIGNFKNIAEAVEFAKNWYEKYIDGNVSPCYNVNVDKEYLAIIHQCGFEDLKIDTNDLQSLCESLFELDNMIDAARAAAGLDELEKRRKDVNAAIQSIVKPLLLDKEDKDSLDTRYYTFTCSKTRKVNYDAMEKDGVTDLYVSMSSAIRTKRK